MLEKHQTIIERLRTVVKAGELNQAETFQLFPLDGEVSTAKVIAKRDGSQIKIEISKGSKLWRTRALFAKMSEGSRNGFQWGYGTITRQQRWLELPQLQQQYQRLTNAVKGAK